METSKAMEYESRKASSDVLKPRNAYIIKGSTCFERHTAHNQELQTVFAASGLYTHVVTGRCPGWTTARHHMGV